MVTIESSANTAISQIVTAGWSPRRPNAYRCHVAIIREEDGSFSAVVLNLPGAGSCGATEEEALRNLREAVLGVIESHVEAGEEIPWRDPPSCEIPENATHKWILVNA